MRLLLRLGHPLRRLLLRWLRIRTCGVKVLVFNPAGEVLLIRNSYGDSCLYVLPGGGVARGEDPAAAAAREVGEETGLELRGLEQLGTYASTAEGKRDTVHLFRATAAGEPVADGFEVEEARFFPLDGLPAETSAATRRRIAEVKAGGKPGGDW